MLLRLEQCSPLVGQAVFLQAAVGFVGDGIFNEILVK